MKWLFLILKLLPVVVETVTSIESTVGALPGPLKKELAMTAVLTAEKMGEVAEPATVKAISTLIDDVVTKLNASGAFTKR